MIIIIIIIVIVEIVTYGENLVNLKLTLPFSPYAISAPFFYANFYSCFLQDPFLQLFCRFQHCQVYLSHA